MWRITGHHDKCKTKKHGAGVGGDLAGCIVQVPLDASQLHRLPDCGTLQVDVAAGDTCKPVASLAGFTAAFSRLVSLDE